MSDGFHHLFSRALNSNNFTGKIPASLGNLSKVYWLDLADNQLTGPIPISSGSSPGLDLLLKAKHLWVFLLQDIFCLCMSSWIFSSEANSKILQSLQQESALRHHSTKTFQLWDDIDPCVSQIVFTRCNPSLNINMRFVLFGFKLSRIFFGSVISKKSLY